MFRTGDTSDWFRSNTAGSGGASAVLMAQLVQRSFVKAVGSNAPHGFGMAVWHVANSCSFAARCGQVFARALSLRDPAHGQV